MFKSSSFGIYEAKLHPSAASCLVCCFIMLEKISRLRFTRNFAVVEIS